MAARIFIVEDHTTMVEAYRSIFAMEPDMEVCGSAQTAQEALAALPEAQADIVLVDVSLPGANGIDLVEQMQVTHPEVKALVISGHHEEVYAKRALAAGARGYIDKRGLSGVLLEAVRSVLNGEIYLSEAVRSRQ